jgi:hypothetical protein
MTNTISFSDFATFDKDGGDTRKRYLHLALPYVPRRLHCIDLGSSIMT